MVVVVVVVVMSGRAWQDQISVKECNKNESKIFRKLQIVN